MRVPADCGVKKFSIASSTRLHGMLDFEKIVKHRFSTGTGAGGVQSESATDTSTVGKKSRLS